MEERKRKELKELVAELAEEVGSHPISYAVMRPGRDPLFVDLFGDDIQRIVLSALILTKEEAAGER